MKTLLTVLFVAVAAPNVLSQYQIDWFTMDGGGGSSSGGAYTLVGTIGQPDAAVSSGGRYALQGGFWSAFVPPEAAPALRIFLSGEKMILAWPNPSSGFQLQAAASLTASQWTNVNEVPAIVDGENQISHPPASGMMFYRLRQP